MDQQRADLGRFETDARNPGSRFSSPRITIGCLSVLRREKNLHLLLLAAARLLPAVPSLHVLLVGSGPEDSNLKQTAAQLGIVNHCEFQPAAKNVAYWLSQIDIFVLPSSTEALSNSLMEAMASKCAIVASNVGGTPELIRDGETGLLFASGNISELVSRILHLIRDPAVRALLARNASDLIHREFTIQQSAQRMSEIYRHFIDIARHSSKVVTR
jgi:glycosyltransferase involved in cell wall biosynthesis